MWHQGGKQPPGVHLPALFRIAQLSAYPILRHAVAQIPHRPGPTQCREGGAKSNGGFDLPGHLCQPQFHPAGTKGHSIGGRCRSLAAQNLTDKDIVNVNLGDSATVNFDAYPGETFPAGVTEIANAADPYTGTYTVEVELEPTEKRLISGFIARVYIIPDVRASLMRIPVESLVDGLGRNGYVFVAEGNKAARKKIKIARVDDRSLIVESGLEPGDSVITTGAQYVRDGEEIEIVENLIK